MRSVNNIHRIVKWFCRQLTLNELSCALAIILDVVSGKRQDIETKPDPKPPHYRRYQVDAVEALASAPCPKEEIPGLDWKRLLAEHQKRTGKALSPVGRRSSSHECMEGIRCRHCGAPSRYLYSNNGKSASQVLCKICQGVSQTHKTRRSSAARYWCPHCGCALFKWKGNTIETVFKCPSRKCPHYLSRKDALNRVEKRMLKKQPELPHFKLHYQYREYHFSPDDLRTASPEEPVHGVDLRKIHNDSRTLSLVLSYSVNIGLSTRQTRDAMKGFHGITVSHQTVLNYMKSAAFYLAPSIDSLTPPPSGKAVADETYIIVDGVWNYTWFVIDSASRAICGFNLSDNRGVAPAFALLCKCFGKPEEPRAGKPELVTDGNPSYDCATMAYNSRARKNHISKRTVVGLQNLDEESSEYRRFKQMVERLSRTYKFHTRPRAGFKSFDGALSLTVLFIAYCNFMRPHSARGGTPPVRLEFLRDVPLYPDMWSKLLLVA
ncbi:MAG: DDE-type integrase/transposase/recombinase [Victivallales bacterium]